MWLALTVVCTPADAQLVPAGERTHSSGFEIAFGSGHADRGYVISDRPVVQPVTWVSAGAASFSVWSSVTLGETTDGARPQIVEAELTIAPPGKRLTVAPALRMFFYNDLVGPDRTHSIEGWLSLSYDAGPVDLFSNHSIDVGTYPGAYFGEVGIESAGRLAASVEAGGALSTGWASRTFTQTYAGLSLAALHRVSLSAWLTAHLTPHLYIGPQLEFGAIVHRAVRAELTRPTYVLLKLTTGGEF